MNNICEACGKHLTKEDWPWIWRFVGKLCTACKNKADKLLHNKRQ